MKFIECLQGESEWYAARCGRITASCFADAVSTVGGLTEQQAKYVAARNNGGMSEKDAATHAGYKTIPTSDIVRRALAGERTEEFSDTARRYAADLSIERVSQQPHGEPFKTWVLERGHTMEEAARRQYEARTGSFVTEAGICLTDDDLFGYSTDGLVDDDGLIEIKAPVDSIKIREMWLTGDTSEYDHQMQGGMWVTGRKWCDFIMYVPDLAAVGKDLFVKRVYRDDAFVDAMVAQLIEFEKLVSENEALWREGAPVSVPLPQDDDSLIVDAAFEPTPEPAEIVPAPTETPTLRGQPLPMAWPYLAEDKPQVVPTTPPTLRLGQIADRLRFALTADFLRSLGFEPAARDKAAMLYHERDFTMICAALVRHIGSIQAKQAA